jgi:hypothetical protein
LNKKLNLFLIKNNNNINLTNNLINNYKINLLANVTLFNSSDYKALHSLLRCFSILSTLKKTIFIYNNNYIIILNNKNVKYMSTYKFNNIEISYVYKLYMISKSDIFINATDHFIKFKSEHERFLQVIIDCYHINLPRSKALVMVIKMLIICLYVLN